jgi:hypothetical protein
MYVYNINSKPASSVYMKPSSEDDEITLRKCL